MSNWTNVPKPTESSILSQTIIGGLPIGLLLALTQSSIVSSSSSITSGWTAIPKPTS